MSDITRPDWRNLRRMPLRNFHMAIVDTYNEMNLPVLQEFVIRHAVDDLPYKYYTDLYGCTQIEGVVRYDQRTKMMIEYKLY